MTPKQIEDMLLDVIKELDYDIWKSCMPEFAEEPEEALKTMTALVKVAQKHLKKAAKKMDSLKML
jgi:hypothetical protein